MAKKKRGPGRPPTTGPGYAIQIRVHPNFLQALDEWRERQNGGAISRPEAVRQLAWLALLSAGKGREK
jgi:hypothetical protein